jgi:hypothetical protein
MSVAELVQPPGKQEPASAPKFSSLRDDHCREALPCVRARLILENKPEEGFELVRNGATGEGKGVARTLLPQGRLGEGD